MTTEIETLRTATTNLRIERDALSTKLDAQKLDYELLSDDYRALEANSNALKTKNLQLIAEREVFRTAIRELRTENSQLTTECHVFHTIMKELRTELDEVRSTNQKLNETLGGLLTENGALRQKFDDEAYAIDVLGG